jgi:phenylalanyl-tRNA synthetase alpha chain
MDDELASIQQSLQTHLDAISSLNELQATETEYLGRKGKLNGFFARLKDLSAEEVKSAGEKINALKSHIETELAAKKITLLAAEDTKHWIDPTLPGSAPKLGSLHIVSQTIKDIREIFSKIGFINMSYPEVEWEYYAFDSLNMPKIHPARDDFETFFIDAPEHEKYGKMLLTPHTSSGQVREMLRRKEPPVRMINIARTYRPNWDSTHTPIFHQFEGLCIDKNITISHLKGTIEHFVKEFFGRECKIRLRPYDFLFTEPSFEVDIHTGTSTIGRAGWLELGGAGMVHPNVLKEGGIDPQIYSGWAFGFGVERVAMMRGGVSIPDLRVIYSGELGFLTQF